MAGCATLGAASASIVVVSGTTSCLAITRAGTSKSIRKVYQRDAIGRDDARARVYFPRVLFNAAP